jgi:dihydroneopterin aldolase
MAATAATAAGDKILLKGLVFHGFHGVLEEVSSTLLNCFYLFTTLNESSFIFLTAVCFHVVPSQERSLGQKFIINATLTTNLQKAGESDDLHDTINYAAVYTDIKTIVEGKPHLLIESVAETVANKILNSHKSVEDVTIRVEKPHVAVEGVVESLGIEVFRRQKTL